MKVYILHLIKLDGESEEQFDNPLAVFDHVPSVEEVCKCTGIQKRFEGTEFAWITEEDKTLTTLEEYVNYEYKGLQPYGPGYHWGEGSLFVHEYELNK